MTDLDALQAFHTCLAHIVRTGTEDDLFDLLMREASETGGIFDLGPNEIALEIHGIEAKADSLPKTVAAWRRAATVRKAEMVLRAAQVGTHAALEACETILSLSDSETWRRAARDVRDAERARAA